MSRYLVRSVEGNRQRLDGGAMFGNVPRPLWELWIEPDERHRIPLACRAFLIEDQLQGHRILLEAGIGVFFDPALRDRYGVAEPGHQLLASLERIGVAPESIDTVVLSHLHFDHTGGLLTPWRADRPHEPVFPEARLLVSQQAWERAHAPHLRDRASFAPEVLALLEQARSAGRLSLVAEQGEAAALLGDGFCFHLSHGHTPGLLLTELATERGSVVFCGDLIPGRPWIHLPVTMGYDRYPELLIDEKQRLLERCLERDTVLLLTHDAGCAACRVERDRRGRFTATGAIEELSALAL